MTTEIRVAHRGGNHKLRVTTAHKKGGEASTVTVLSVKGDECVTWVHGDNFITIEELPDVPVISDFIGEPDPQPREAYNPLTHQIDPATGKVVPKPSPGSAVSNAVLDKYPLFSEPGWLDNAVTAIVNDPTSALHNALRRYRFVDPKSRG